MRESWESKIGMILAMAGSAIGLGNFLRFPVKAAENGGGAFMIPYFVCFLLLGIPLMWIEWSLGRAGGARGHGTTPFLLQGILNRPWVKYVGVLGVAIPTAFTAFYMCIESWCLAYAFFTASGKFAGMADLSSMTSFLSEFQGRAQGEHFQSILPLVGFFLVTLVVNVWVLSRGIAMGIERVVRIAMPLLFLMAVLLLIRVLTLPAQGAGQSVAAGLAYVWEPDFSKLGNANAWVQAAGQIFFTLSVGMSTIMVYASYVSRKDDIALSGLATAMTNETAEVVLGGSIAIPAAVVFFGVAGTAAIASGGAFNLGFEAMPLILAYMPMGQLFGTFWFLLLFLAGLTSSMATSQVAIAFLQDELGMHRRRAVGMMMAVVGSIGLWISLTLANGVLDEFDFWSGTIGLVGFALIEAVFFAWILGMPKGWKELHEGAFIKVPRIFYYIMKYVTPVMLVALTLWWIIQDAPAVIMMEGKNPEDIPQLWIARGIMVGLFLWLAFLVRKAMQLQKEKGANQ
jgi:neurotransmitter:Na+ symporter, NSS family